MDPIVLRIIDEYLKLISSWWWLTLGFITFIAGIFFALKNGDYDILDKQPLTGLEALKLTCVGISLLLPLTKDIVSLKYQLDFLTRWEVLGLNPFFSFVVTTFLVSLFVMPVMFILVFIIQIDVIYEIETHGLRKVLQKRFLHKKNR